jgi:hypothetical protein
MVLFLNFLHKNAAEIVRTIEALKTESTLPYLFEFLGPKKICAVDPDIYPRS